MTAVASTAKGKILEIRQNQVIFQPAGTTYQLHLQTQGDPGPVGVPVECVIRVCARKIYTVPSGGNFIQPIFGPPRIIQGRVRAIQGQELIVHAGVPITVVLPSEPHAIDLTRGEIAEGSLVNVVALPGATVEFTR
ncbi:MAG: hypothetical protein NZ561_06270 [Phycisphaerae bacterium]|nr:hypothetical protein [Phycisphaerae bacterium]MDW8263262.1 hypothetical protein [Phycisphaerales bacterium]